MTALKIMMRPQLSDFEGEESGIKRVLEAYYRYLPAMGFELVDKKATSFDIVACHAGACPDPDVLHCHGLYFTADYNPAKWEWRVNKDVIFSARQSKLITVPSRWVAEIFQRDMRLNPIVVPHGLNLEEWQGSAENVGYVLWNKNRTGDVCDPKFVGVLAQAFPNIKFVTTFAPPGSPNNVYPIGVKPHREMKAILRGAGVYLATTKETFGIGTLEALASGIPVLGFAYGGNLDLVEHGVTGYLARPNDAEDLIAGLAYCVKHRTILGQNARRAAFAWDWRKSVEKVAAVYRQAIYEPTPSVTVVIPSFKYASVVTRAVESALNQSYPVNQVIVIDDGSEDGGETERAVKQIAEKDNRVQYVYQNNQGVANARNHGISLASSKYIVCLDADDAIAPTFVETCIHPLEADRSLGITFTGLTAVKPDGTSGLSPWPTGFEYDRQLQRQNQIPTCCMFRKEMWERLGGYKQRYAPGGAGAEDAEFFLRAGSIGYGAKQVTKDGLFIYSWLSGRVSGNKEYHEVDWTELHPWTKDGMHPFASIATPKLHSHPVRQYDEPLVSVVIPVGPGHEKEVANALDSLESQTIRKWEAIVVWDCPEPPDAALKKAYPYVRWLELGGNHGAGYARNRGVEIARAQMLLFLDADDWLYPVAIERMFDMFMAQQGIIYTDYVGKATISLQEAEKLNNAQRLLYIDQKTMEAVIAHRSEEYSCERARNQPDKEMYIWSLITALTPKAWHKEIGGFDEAMPSWEDWDYWIRMARAGKCFYRLAEQLVVYRFYTGTRRERGLHDANNLIKYLLDKYKKGENMPPCGCRNPVGQPPAQSKSIFKSSETNNNMPGDDNYILVKYDHPNRGQHKVVGGATGTNYGYRGGGETFLVDKRDIAAQPHVYIPVPVQVPIPAENTVEVPPPPELPQAEELENTEKPKIILPVPQDEPKEHGDLQLVPGVTPAVAAQLNYRGIYTVEDIAKMGKEKLMTVKGIGQARADIIMAFAEKALETKTGE